MKKFISHLLSNVRTSLTLDNLLAQLILALLKAAAQANKQDCSPQNNLCGVMS